MLHSTWRRLSHRQFLFLYPFVIGVVEILAFFAVYAAVEPSLGWDGFARAQFDVGGYFNELLRNPDDLRLTVPLIAAVLAGVLVCLISAAVHPAYYRAAAGAPYELAPRSWREVARLFVYYGVTYPVFRLAGSFLPESSLGLLVFFVLLLASGLLVFADYAIVFEGLSIVAAVRRSVRLVRRAWPTVAAAIVALFLIWSGIATLFDNFYTNADRIFILLPVSEILADALILVIADVFFIAFYDYLSRG